MTEPTCERCKLPLEGHTPDMCALEVHFEAFVRAIKAEGVGPIETAIFLAHCSGACFALSGGKENPATLSTFIQLAGEQLLDGVGVRGSSTVIRAKDQGRN